MAEGVKIRHVAARNAIVFVQDLAKPVNMRNGPPPPCKICQVPHMFKKWHIRVDDTGIGIVSVPLWDSLKTLVDNGGFELVGAEPNPPTQTISHETVSPSLWTPESGGN